MDDWMTLYLLSLGYSITDTAKVLCITQPAVTQRVRKMEIIFGNKLFRKKGKGVTPTPHAAEILVYARKLIESIACTFPQAAGYGRGDRLVHYVFGSGSDRTTSKPDDASPGGAPGTDHLHSPVRNDASETVMLPHPQPDVVTGKMV